MDGAQAVRRQTADPGVPDAAGEHARPRFGSDALVAEPGDGLASASMSEPWPADGEALVSCRVRSSCVLGTPDMHSFFGMGRALRCDASWFSVDRERGLVALDYSTNDKKDFSGFDLVITHFGWKHAEPSNCERLLMTMRRSDIRAPVIVFSAPVNRASNRRTALDLGALAFTHEWEELFQTMEAFFRDPGDPGAQARRLP